jgi:hypothetical protein
VKIIEISVPIHSELKMVKGLKYVSLHKMSLKQKKTRGTSENQDNSK